MTATTSETTTSPFEGMVRVLVSEDYNGWPSLTRGTVRSQQERTWWAKPHLTSPAFVTVMAPSADPRTDGMNTNRRDYQLPDGWSGWHIGRDVATELPVDPRLEGAVTVRPDGSHSSWHAGVRHVTIYPNFVYPTRRVERDPQVLSIVHEGHGWAASMSDAAGVGDLFPHQNGWWVRMSAVRGLLNAAQATDSIPTDETEVERLRREVAEAREAHENDLRLISERLGREADDRGWCSDYDYIVNSLNESLSGNLMARPRSWVVSATVEHRITVEAVTQAEAQRIVTERLRTTGGTVSGVRAQAE